MGNLTKAKKPKSASVNPLDDVGVDREKVDRVSKRRNYTSKNKKFERVTFVIRPDQRDTLEEMVEEIEAEFLRDGFDTQFDKMKLLRAMLDLAFTEFRGGWRPRLKMSYRLGDEQ